MGKDAISETKSKDADKNKTSSNSSSPLILIIGVISIIAIGLFLFKDKIFKKKSDNPNLSDLAEEQKEENEITEEEKTVIEEISPKESVEITQRFDATKDNE